MPVHPTSAVNIYWEHHLKLELDIVCGGCQDLGTLVGTGFLEAKAIQDSMGTAREGQAFLSSFHSVQGDGAVPTSETGNL